MDHPTVFISYSHDSPQHADRVLDFANRLVQDGIDCILDQYEPAPSEGWPRWMDRHIRDADFVLMICTEIYYRRVMGEEEPGTGRGVKWEGNLIYNHIYDADVQNPRFIPVLFESGRVDHIPAPLKGATRYHVDNERGYEDLYRRLTDQPRAVKPELGKARRLPPRERKQDFFAGPDQISTSRLPITGQDLFGREKELAALDAAWADPGANVLSLVAWGGVGKSALVNHWLGKMAADHYRGARRVYGWSFYSQGTRETAASADQFIDAALGWFGDSDPTQGSPWDKGERLARLVREARTLLVLDGLEPLQNPPGPEEGRLKDPALCALVRELAAANPGLLVITTRQRVADIGHHGQATAPLMPLEHLSDAAGAELLRSLGVQGTQEELEAASRDFGGHGLALNLVGTYLRDVLGGDVRRRGEVSLLEGDEEQGGHARRVMVSYERWLGEGPEVAVLRLIGLFDRPADGGALAVLRAEPAIAGLSDTLFYAEEQKGLRAIFRKRKPEPLSDRDWKRAVTKLRRAKLLAIEDPEEPEALDAHPLVREHFGQRLEGRDPDAWREAHSRLYEYYGAQAPELPNTLEEMTPLYAAVAHGCQAGRHQEALDEVYSRRIRRRREAFSVKKLGAFGADLAALSGFFDPPWRRTVAGLREDFDEAFVLAEAGFCLRALGRLREAAQPMQASLETLVVQKNWKQAAIAASNLSELALTGGDVTGALESAQHSVDFADRSGDAFWRMGSRTTLADAQHQAGRLEEAEALFVEAEEMQKEDQPQFPLLYSLRGFLYCDLLLGQGKHEAVHSRAAQTLEWVTEEQWLLDIALDHLSLGRAHLMQALQEGTEDPSASLTCASAASAGRTGFSQAEAHIERAVDGLREAGAQEFIVRGLLARAALRRASGDFDRAGADLEEATSIVTRGGMRLFEADCHLEYARLHLATGEKDQAGEHLAAAKALIEEMGYGRRVGEVEELEDVMRDA